MTEEPALRYTYDEYQKLQVAVETTISKYSGLHDAKISTIEDYIHNHLIVRLTAYVWSKHDPVEFSWPATLWDHCKQRLNEQYGWNLAVKLTTKTVYQTIMYPELTVKSPTPTLRIARQYDQSE